MSSRASPTASTSSSKSCHLEGLLERIRLTDTPQSFEVQGTYLSSIQDCRLAVPGDYADTAVRTYQLRCDELSHAFRDDDTRQLIEQHDVVANSDRIILQLDTELMLYMGTGPLSVGSLDITVPGITHQRDSWIRAIREGTPQPVCPPMNSMIEVTAACFTEPDEDQFFDEDGHRRMTGGWMSQGFVTGVQATLELWGPLAYIASYYKVLQQRIPDAVLHDDQLGFLEDAPDSSTLPRDIELDQDENIISFPISIRQSNVGRRSTVMVSLYDIQSCTRPDAEDPCHFIRMCSRGALELTAFRPLQNPLSGTSCRCGDPLTFDRGYSPSVPPVS